MNLIIAGSRRGLFPGDEYSTDQAVALVDKCILESGIPVADIKNVISGTAQGADMFGEWWAGRRHIPITRMSADWARYGRNAGPIRNRDMAEAGDAAIVIWNGYSSGSRDMIYVMESLGKPVFVYTQKPQQ